jgi:hypothetical protein
MTTPSSPDSPGLDRRALLAGAAALLASACVDAPRTKLPSPPMIGLDVMLREQSLLYPQMEAMDLYKLLHQAVMGPSYFFIGSESKLLSGLITEIRQLQPALIRDEPEIERLYPERNLVRLNLRPFLKRGGKAEELAHALCETGRTYRGNREEFEATLDASLTLLDSISINTTLKDYRKHVEQMRQRGLPPGIHSEAYAMAYRPAYRLVLPEHLTDPQYGGRDAPA